MTTIVLAGGCFWGVEAYFKQLKGITDTSVGYVDGNMRNPSYEMVCNGQATHTEAVKVSFDPDVVSLDGVLDHFFRIINPFSLNRQGNDIGRQYRSGIYVENEAMKEAVLSFLDRRFENERSRVRTEVKACVDYDVAEDYHQDYLDKNPFGYCHVNMNLAAPEEKK
ncbi:MAG: peptide-methionine (S)-S-oxide reductase MsrA [Acholeplasmataceae bacterium]|nr:peptide-methionine (S)-S-oxide reductase MsrA [Acholeplasmataceae bacterium]